MIILPKRIYTEQQEKAINARGGSVLVSAAAGSGKTSVLTERVIRLITDKENPIRADRLLIVTFTKASAAEMKQRSFSILSAKGAILKKYASSLASTTSRPQSGHLPSLS